MNGQSPWNKIRSGGTLYDFTKIRELAFCKILRCSQLSLLADLTATIAISRHRPLISLRE
jgi:hypothetical protein